MKKLVEDSVVRTIDSWFVGDNHEVGSHTYGIPYVYDFAGNYLSKIIIGDYTAISHGVMFVVRTEHKKNISQNLPDRDIHKNEVITRVGSDVTIGYNTTILEGSHISDGCLIGACSVVRGYIPPYAIAYGNPCQVHRYRYTPLQIGELMKIKWWNWSEEKVLEAYELLTSDNIDEFINRYRI